MDTIRQFEGAMCEETGTSRNGFRERRLETQVGAIALRVPKLREGTCFPEGIVERWSRVDRAVICAASEMFALGVSTRKVGKVLEKMGAARLSKDRVSRICFELDAEVSELRGRDLSGRRFPYLWMDATYVPCRRGDGSVPKVGVGLGSRGWPQAVRRTENRLERRHSNACHAAFPPGIGSSATASSTIPAACSAAAPP